MRELPSIIPDVTAVLGMEPEELATKLLFLIKNRITVEPSFMIHRTNLESEPFGRRYDGSASYPDEFREQFYLAFAEAWSWLEAQGLLVPAIRGGADGARSLSRRASRFESEVDVTNYFIAQLLPRDRLNKKFADRVWAAFIRGEFDVAVFQAMKAVEVAVRDASQLPARLIGTALIQEAFKPQSGPLTDLLSEPGEQVARMNLFMGAIGSYKNPHSHRHVNLSDPYEAMEIVLLANHLLRIVENVKLVDNDSLSQ